MTIMTDTKNPNAALAWTLRHPFAVAGGEPRDRLPTWALDLMKRAADALDPNPGEVVTRPDIAALVNAPPRLSDLKGEERAFVLRERHEANRSRWLDQHKPRRGFAGALRSFFGGA